MPANVHPRRRPAWEHGPSTSSLIDSFQNMSLQKGQTFHPSNRDNNTELWDPLSGKAAVPSIPSRSTTCPKSLEDLLIGAGERRAADLLARVDKAIETQSKLALGHVLSEPEVLPVPSFMVDTPEDTENTLKARSRHDSHSSDSGIGSSVADSTESLVDKEKTSSAIDNQMEREPVAAASSSNSTKRALSSYANKQIHKHIVKPILDEEPLREFHPLIKDVPERIGNKDITTLRELEKTLIFLAPDYSSSPSKYLKFCERTIRVLHTTVTTLHESDQRAPSDRPYTQGYFFDLVEQIRRYANILAASRARQARGEAKDKMDINSDEHVSLHGGVTHNGKPAELVRHSEGKVISLATGDVLSSEEVAAGSMKRHMADDEVDNDDVARSMARRKKGAKPEKHDCPLCDKEFTRPCDLTKHVKTHERPWKCPEAKCKYHNYGWPTEKERDRHVNDKHSAAPALYHCLYKPCPYTSKRESNCKQHMEKAHGWEYVRSKSNGKNKMDVPHLQRGSIPPSPMSAVLTPLTPIAPSPSGCTGSGASRRSSLAPPSAGPSSSGTPALTHPSPDFAGHFNMDFNFNDMSYDIPSSSSTFPITPAMSDDYLSSASSGLQLDGSSFEDALSPDQFTFTSQAFDFSNFQHASNQSSGCKMAQSASEQMPHTSPGAQLDLTFTSSGVYDPMSVDQNYEAGFGAPEEDFQLFGNNNQELPTSSSDEMFPSMGGQISTSSWGNFGGQFNFNSAPSMNTGNSTLDDLFPELRDN